MAEATAPQLETNIEIGHSLECKNLDIRYYQDLFRDIQDTVRQVREMLNELVDSDVEFAVIVDSVLNQCLQGHDKFYKLIPTANRLQELIRKSELDDGEKGKIWQPIAECYKRVQVALTEKIIPIDQRELIAYGDTITLPVELYRLPAGRIGSLVTLPKFKYALLRHTRDGGAYRDSISRLNFRDNYLSSLPESTREKFPGDGIIKLPLKIVSVEYGMLTIVELDEEAFAAM